MPGTGMELFRSFWMGGFEGADHVNSHGVPLHLNHSNGHAQFFAHDYAAMAQLGLRTVRESIGWRAGTHPDGALDVARLQRMNDAAEQQGLQVLWTLHHYGLPPGMDFFAPDFAARFAGFCDQVARALHGQSDGPLLFQPINEISFLSWAAGSTNLIHPYLGESQQRGHELKCRLVAAALQGCDALWATAPQARMVHTDPLIHVVADAPADAGGGLDASSPDWEAQAHALAQAQFEAWDMLCGRLEPGLGGAPRYLDVLGVNYYHDNQWQHPSGRRLDWHLGNARRRGLDDLLVEVWQRYGRPLCIAETGHIGAGRARWIDSVARAAQSALARGVPLQGICLYPLLDRPDWENPAHWHRSGLWEVRGQHGLPLLLQERAPAGPSSRGSDAADSAGSGLTAAQSAVPPLVGPLARHLHLPAAQQLARWQRVLHHNTGAPAAPDMPADTAASPGAASTVPASSSVSEADSAAGALSLAAGACTPAAAAPGSGLPADFSPDLSSFPSVSSVFSSHPKDFSMDATSVSAAASTAMLSPLTLIVFSHLRWDFVYQRPQQLLSRLARRLPVLFVEEPIPGAAIAALEVMDPEPGVRVLRAHVTSHGAGFHDAHTAQVQELLLAYLHKQAIDRYWLWFYTPMALPLADPLAPQGVVYDCMDELSAFHFAPPELLQRESDLFARADLVFTGGHSLFEAKRMRHPNVHCFPSSVDAAHFGRARQAGAADHGAQAHLAHPRLGYFGVIDERIDLSLVAAVADAHADWQVVMVGPVVKVDPASLPQRANLHWLGQRDYAELPELVAGWDVCLMPFALNDSTRFISPTKTLEYLAAGRPVVSTPIRDVVVPYDGIVAIADTPGAFVAACEAALARSPEEAACQAFAVQKLLARTSWDGTATAMAELLQDLQPARQQANAPAAQDHAGLAPATGLDSAPVAL